MLPFCYTRVILKVMCWSVIHMLYTAHDGVHSPVHVFSVGPDPNIKTRSRNPGSCQLFIMLGLVYPGLGLSRGVCPGPGITFQDVGVYLVITFRQLIDVAVKRAYHVGRQTYLIRADSGALHVPATQLEAFARRDPLSGH